MNWKLNSIESSAMCRGKAVSYLYQQRKVAASLISNDEETTRLRQNLSGFVGRVPVGHNSSHWISFGSVSDTDSCMIHA